MRPARFLPEGEGHAERHAAGERDARRPPAAQQEVEAQQREARGRVRAREAARPRQLIGAIGEQPDVGPHAAESNEIPGTIHVRGGLERADDARGKHDREQGVGRTTPSRPEGRPRAAREQREQCAGSDRAHQIATTLVQQLIRPPLTGAEPASRLRIVEPESCNPGVGVREDDGRIRGDEHRARHERVGEKEAVQARRPVYS